MDDQPQKKSYKLVWIAGSSFAVLVVVVGVTFLLVSASTSKDKTVNSVAQTTTSPVITKAEVSKNLSDMNTSLNQAKTEEAAAKAALDDSQNQVKLVN